MCVTISEAAKNLRSEYIYPMCITIGFKLEPLVPKMKKPAPIRDSRTGRSVRWKSGALPLFCVGRGRKGQAGLGWGQTEHTAQGILGFFEALVGFAVTLLGVFEVVAEFLERIGEIFHLFLHAGQAAEEALGVFFDLHAAQAHGDDAEMGIERVGRNGNDVAVAAVGVDGLT